MIFLNPYIALLRGTISFLFPYLICLWGSPGTECRGWHRTLPGAVYKMRLFWGFIVLDGCVHQNGKLI